MESQKKWTLTEGVDMEISHQPPKMRSVANLIIAMERMKAGVSETLLSSEFRDEQLLSFMLESIVEEQRVFERTSAPTQNYTKGEEIQCSVTDTENKTLVWVPSNMELNAVILQGGADTCKIHMSMSIYLHPTPPAESQIVTLGIRGTNYFLSCYKEGEVPTLRLERVENKASLESITSDSDMKRFLFYKHVTGLNYSTLVSVLYTDYYISTARENNRPVELCQQNAQRHRTFVVRTLKNNKRCERQL